MPSQKFKTIAVVKAYRPSNKVISLLT